MRGRAMVNGISALTKGTPQNFRVSSARQREDNVYEKEVGSHQIQMCQHLDPGRPSPQNCEQ